MVRGVPVCPGCKPAKEGELNSRDLSKVLHKAKVLRGAALSRVLAARSHLPVMTHLRAWAHAQTSLRSKMKNLTHVPHSATLWAEWGEYAAGFVDWWASTRLGRVMMAPSPQAAGEACQAAF